MDTTIGNESTPVSLLNRKSHLSPKKHDSGDPSSLTRTSLRSLHHLVDLKKQNVIQHSKILAGHEDVELWEEFELDPETMSPEEETLEHTSSALEKVIFDFDGMLSRVSFDDEEENDIDTDDDSTYFDEDSIMITKRRRGKSPTLEEKR